MPRTDAKNGRLTSFSLSFASVLEDGSENCGKRLPCFSLFPSSAPSGFFQCKRAIHVAYIVRPVAFLVENETHLSCRFTDYILICFSSRALSVAWRASSFCFSEWTLCNSVHSLIACQSLAAINLFPLINLQSMWRKGSFFPTSGTLPSRWYEC